MWLSVIELDKNNYFSYVIKIANISIKYVNTKL